LPYLFGGAAQVAQMGYAEYARRGFFELVWVAGLTLPLLLWMHWLLRTAAPASQRTYKVLAFGLVCLLLVVVASAMQRMQLYVATLGMTELRLQASMFMGWLTMVLGWFMLTVLRDRRRRFAFGALASAFVVIAGLNVVNPDALIVRTNAYYGQLESDDGRFDQRPLASLSADAVPAIVAALPQMSAPGQQAVLAALQQRFAAGPTDWRTYNWSRDAAREALAALGPVGARGGARGG
jgi:hypothetical protein